jgi:hypothetical protein
MENLIVREQIITTCALEGYHSVLKRSLYFNHCPAAADVLYCLMLTCIKSAFLKHEQLAEDAHLYTYPYSSMFPEGNLDILPSAVARILFREMEKVMQGDFRQDQVDALVRSLENNPEAKDACISWVKYNVPCKHRLAAHVQGRSVIDAGLWSRMIWSCRVGWLEDQLTSPSDGEDGSDDENVPDHSQPVRSSNWVARKLLFLGEMTHRCRTLTYVLHDHAPHTKDDIWASFSRDYEDLVKRFEEIAVPRIAY